MTDKTRAELVNQALAYLGLKQGQQAANADDYDVVDDLVDPALDTLKAKNIVHVANHNAINPALFLPLAMYLAAKASPTFGPAMDATAAERELRVIVADVPTYEVQYATYY
jgi:hypothetical protein